MQMQRRLSMAIVGAGISGLTLAVNLLKHPLIKITVIEKEQRLGGRVFTEEVASNVYADLGANIIDFQSKSQQAKVSHFLSNLTKHENAGLELLKQPFLIYENNTLRKGDYEKSRYFYKNGFKQLIYNLQQKIGAFPEQCSILRKTHITQIEKISEKWELYNNEHKLAETFDVLVLSCNGFGVLDILSTSNSQKLSHLRQQIAKIKYSKQISFAFQVTKQPNFSSVLFKNHPITFISSHVEKYPQQVPVIVIQTNQEFSEKNFHQTDLEIEKAFQDVVPQFLRCTLGKCLKIKKWWPSLIKEKQLNTLKERQQLDNHLFITGDVFTGGSRVSNAIESSLTIGSVIQEHLLPKL